MQPLRRAPIVSVEILMTDILLNIHVQLLAKVTHRKHAVDLVPMMSGKSVSRPTCRTLHSSSTFLDNDLIQHDIRKEDKNSTKPLSQ